ncbi:hypothetical protein Taro_020564 [Colocasia esculenta]|uniref:UFSP1/2/DUB catalytic domain-containing protein n=1 Tax=Colocasia esculenta TaxID=4460 RepID=A0A843V2P8_COLES|nr:hypothetical protein [Colocasia esculenta]
MSSSCPFCNLNVPLADLEWHANNHFEEEELARDAELAHQIAIGPPSPVRMDEPMESAELSTVLAEVSAECSTSISRFNPNNCIERLFQDNISHLVKLQKKGSFHKVEGGLMVLLKRCLDMESDYLRSVISGHVDHFQSIESEDSGWGCGWRNVQMLSSHLLMERQEVKDVMFGGSGFVPDIPSLQRWLEVAWKRGFDDHGAKSFNYKIYGSKKWIGTTECAALLRSFGLRARIVDFDGETIGSLRKGKRKVQQAFGPMDKFLLHSITNNKARPASLGIDNHSSVDHDINNCLRKTNGPQILVEWVWNYFNSGVSGRCTQQVAISQKTPLYFQHSGHSRTIVGIQMKKGVQGMPDTYNLLVLDPGQGTTAIEMSLREKKGWQQLLKRGMHTLRKSQYQLCYIDNGIACEAEIEHLKFIESALIKI